MIRKSQVTLTVVLLTLAGLTALLALRHQAAATRRLDLASIHALGNLAGEGKECKNLYGIYTRDFAVNLYNAVQPPGYAETRKRLQTTIIEALGEKAWNDADSGTWGPEWDLVFFELDTECPRESRETPLTVEDGLRRLDYVNAAHIDVPVAVELPDSLCELDCKNPRLIMQAGTESSSGFWRCDDEDESVVRKEKVECVTPARPEGCRDATEEGCQTDEECQTDEDCKEGKICVCAGVYNNDVAVCGWPDVPWYCERDLRGDVKLDLRLSEGKIIFRLAEHIEYSVQSEADKYEASWPVTTLPVRSPDFLALSNSRELELLATLKRDDRERLLRLYGDVPLAVAPGLAEESYAAIFQDVEVLGFSIPASTAPIVLMVVLFVVCGVLYAVRNPPRVFSVDPVAEGLFASLLLNAWVRMFAWVIVPLVTFLILVALGFPSTRNTTPGSGSSSSSASDSDP